jgi:hypothetical protein
MIGCSRSGYQKPIANRTLGAITPLLFVSLALTLLCLLTHLATQVRRRVFMVLSIEQVTIHHHLRSDSSSNSSHTCSLMLSLSILCMGRKGTVLLRDSRPIPVCKGLGVGNSVIHRLRRQRNTYRHRSRELLPLPLILTTHTTSTIRHHHLRLPRRSKHHPRHLLLA